MSDFKFLKEDFDFIEKLIIKKCLEDDHYLSLVCPHLSENLFSTDHNKFIVKLLSAYYKKYSKIPKDSEIKIFLNNDKCKRYFSIVKKESNDISSDVDKDMLLSKTEKYIKIKNLEHNLLNMAETWDKGINNSDLISYYNNIEYIVGINIKLKEGHDYFLDIDNYINNITSEETYISSGINWIDKKLGGGFLESGRSMYVFAGETNIGKSLFLHNIAINILKQNKKVLIFTLEMSEQMYCNRLTSTICDMDNRYLRDNIDTIKDKVDEFKNMYVGSGLILKEYAPNTVPPTALKYYLKDLQMSLKYKPDVIILDYLNLLKGVGDGLYSIIKNTSEQVRSLSYEFECPVITATQVNRSGYGNKKVSNNGPDLVDIGESYGMGATADVVFGIFRLEEDREENAIRLKILKNRFGDNYGNTRIGINYSNMSIYEDENLNLESSDIDETAQKYGKVQN